ncbi:MAG: hypothetical protein ACLTTH_07770 [Holdemanella porci]
MPFLTWMLHDQMAKTAVTHVSKDIIIKTVGTSAATTTAAEQLLQKQVHPNQDLRNGGQVKRRV